MLTITENAARRMQGFIDRADRPGAGMRISRRSAPDTEARRPAELSMHVVASSEDGDEELVAPGGVRVFVEPLAAPLLEDRVLDVARSDDGRESLVLNTSGA